MRLQTHTAFGFLFPCLPQNRRSCCCVCLFSQKSGDLFPALFRERIAVAVIRPNFFLVLGEQRDRLDLRPQNQNLFLFLCLFHCLNLALITGDACEDRMIQHGIFLVVQPPEQETQPGVVCGMGILVAGENDQHLVAALFQQMQERDRVNDAAVYIVSAVQLYRFTEMGRAQDALIAVNRRCLLPASVRYAGLPSSQQVATKSVCIDGCRYASQLMRLAYSCAM